MAFHAKLLKGRTYHQRALAISAKSAALCNIGTRHAAASWVGFCLYGDGVAYPFPEGRASLLVCQMNCALKIEKLCNNKLLSISKPHKSKVV